MTTLEFAPDQMNLLRSCLIDNVLDLEKDIEKLSGNKELEGIKAILESKALLIIKLRRDINHQIKEQVETRAKEEHNQKLFGR